MTDLWVVATITLRCCRGVDDTLAVVLWFSTTLLDADRLCTDDSSLVLLQYHRIISQHQQQQQQHMEQAVEVIVSE